VSGGLRGREGPGESPTADGKASAERRRRLLPTPRPAAPHPLANARPLSPNPPPDTDECVPGGGNDCHPDAECRDSPGGFTCQCKPGFNGTTGRDCAGAGPRAAGPPPAGRPGAVGRRVCRAQAFQPRRQEWGSSNPGDLRLTAPLRTGVRARRRRARPFVPRRRRRVRRRHPPLRRPRLLHQHARQLHLRLPRRARLRRRRLHVRRRAAADDHPLGPRRVCHRAS
jgi:hypothetical protein